MLVKHILEDKGREIIAISIDATLGSAAAMLAERRVGALIVRDKAGGLAGILSERDMVRAIAGDGAAALSHPVRKYMTAKVKTCTEADAIEDLMEMMTQGRFRHVPVLDGEGRLCGLISIGDVVKSRIAETVSEAESLRGYISATG